MPILLTVGAQIHGLRWGVRSPLARERREMKERRKRPVENRGNDGLGKMKGEEK